MCTTCMYTYGRLYVNNVEGLQLKTARVGCVAVEQIQLSLARKQSHTPIFVFPEMKLLDLIPNSYIHVHC
jgi:hypothetical protein